MEPILAKQHYKLHVLSLLGIAFIMAIFGNGALWHSHQALLQWWLPAVSVLLLLHLGWRIRQASLSVGTTALYLDIKLCWVALLLCSGGDLINVNPLQIYHRQDTVIKHDYLIDSIWLFASGYGLLLWLLVRMLKREFSLTITQTTLLIVVAAVLSSLSYYQLYLPNISLYSLLLSAGYSFLVALLAVFGGWLAVQNLRLGLRLNYAVALGFILAMVADAIIGQFWLFANNGEGYFPIARHVNWIIYISSQALLLLFPIALIRTHTMNQHLR
ncbi:hypothetical protein J8Z24_20125 [Pseudoalteromonas sp. SCSIO 43201]|uniref:Uncharacterized protein n=1 Tax=Pseudoalteromonas peptidolytica F12-50-A1 TaxID=1315280 RepID=A0A8I0T6D2_9GAMM|nr:MULTISPECIES: hypothetical protein [Pseudoalteromonas]MBE0349005.1 hypothetical protein [Pseudoalteromonas peptidolytica F12-50-A1]MDW7548852.1 hypothetical protein [Pseudoalteromonas peptidolytica]NLR15837.1 hypothetical protein [Pseudoalteromonas peptidolytica]USD30438.1 hypothetical protein J8Z24_20125 [Pseudoalteromonas sp. SCSIO 43201]GEK09486.1 hypothetical protein PPE03_17350 [Pseudoalteromonas peptidolytica]